MIGSRLSLARAVAGGVNYASVRDSVENNIRRQEQAAPFTPVVRVRGEDDRAAKRKKQKGVVSVVSHQPI